MTKTCPYCHQQNQSTEVRCSRCETGLSLSPMGEDSFDIRLEQASRTHGPLPPPLLDPYLELLECDLKEARLISNLLEQEGIACLAEKLEEFQGTLHDDSSDHLYLQKGLMIKVKAGEYSKARAVLAWEIQQEIEEGLQLSINSKPSQRLACPSCHNPILEEDETCGECGSAIPTLEDVIAEPYRCWICASTLNPPDRACPSCGSRLDN